MCLYVCMNVYMRMYAVQVYSYSYGSPPPLRRRRRGRPESLADRRRIFITIARHTSKPGHTRCCLHTNRHCDIAGVPVG